MAPCGREHLQRARLGILDHGRQVADHAAGPLSQGHLNCEVQVLDDVTERARHLQDGDLTYGAFSQLSLKSSRWTG
jgi:hypothetical protein